MNFLPLKNYDLIKWCKINQFQREILQFDHYDIFKKIIKHIEETGLTGLIDANECYNLSYRPYMNAVYSLRNIRSHSMKFRRIARYYRNISINLDKYIQWLPFWDNSLLKFSEILRKDEYFIPKADIEESKEYPLHISKSTLLPSLMLWVFVTKNWEEICSPAWMRGRIFEDKIETELINRGVNILHKNLSLSPNDEVDFICEADGKYYVIEAKNYGPFWDYNYLSSSKYSARVDEINSKIAYAPRRLLMINANISKYGMPSGEKAQGIIITSFDEPGLIIPDI
ncbi:MAG: hypothetical protein NT094_04655, partial [Candidatus Staskawiczbacteria bacterium]|nr:hypothetical protein [Candidatus Staskawiczbacteria bacterium]